MGHPLSASQFNSEEEAVQSVTGDGLDVTRCKIQYN